MLRVFGKSASGRGTSALLRGTSAAALVIGVGLGAAQADELTWDAGAPGGPGSPQPANGVWDNTSDVWNNGGVADNFDAGDDVIFADGTLPGSYTITVDNTAIVGSIEFKTPDFTLDAGTGYIYSGGMMTGDLIMTNHGTINADLWGSWDISAPGSGTLTYGGVATNLGTLTINSGGLNNTGTLVDSTGGGAGQSQIVNNGGTFTNTGTFDNYTQNSGVSSLAGTANDDVTLSAGTADITGAFNIGGMLTNAITLDVDSAVTAGEVVNSGTLNVDSALTVTNDIDNSGTMNVNAATSAATLVNSNVLSIDTGVTLTGALENSGTTTLGDAATITGLVTQTGGTINMDGGATMTGGYTGAGTIDMGINDATGDTLTISGGDINFDGVTLNYDIDLGGGTTDLVNTSGGEISGAVTLAFDNITGGTGAGPLTVLTYDTAAANFSATATGLGLVGANLYYLDDSNAGQLDVNYIANPNLGGIAGGVVLTQSMIGSIVNRPTSPFVVGVALPGDDPCGPGAWGRVTGGKADASGTTTTTSGITTLSTEGEISGQYAGIQLGADFSCTGGYYNGWDLAFGGMLGVNMGSTEQPVFDIDPNTQLSLGTVASVNNTDFTQSYAGVYVTAFRDRWLMDLQYRVENVDFDLDNSADGTPQAYGTIDQSFSSQGQTLSGSVSYSIPINEDLRVSFVPTAGFSYSMTSTDSIQTASGTLQIEDFTSEIGFIGGTVSRTIIQPSGNSALTYFGTATYYKDFADPITSTLGTDVIESPNLGQYGEISAGVSYTRLLEPGDIGAARQLNASVRLDGRASDTINSWGLTGQVRISF